MSAFDQHRSPIISRPWFASLAMTIGMSAMASARTVPRIRLHLRRKARDQRLLTRWLPSSRIASYRRRLNKLKQRLSS